MQLNNLDIDLFTYCLSKWLPTIIKLPSDNYQIAIRQLSTSLPTIISNRKLRLKMLLPYDKT